MPENERDLVSLSFLAPTSVEPEGHCLALMLDRNSKRFLPIWIDPIGFEQVSRRFDRELPTRPDTHDLLQELLELRGGVIGITIVGVNDGTFFVEVKTGNGDVLDTRMSDALIISLQFEIDITVSEELLAQHGVYATSEDLAEYFNIEIDDDLEDAEVDDRPNADSPTALDEEAAHADFDKWMKEMGIDESEFGTDLDS
ncbi:MAG: bifunctional nuclease domain-containing protein [Corynebacterium sp.]|nr:bifunctional nuclease domain-containing protein [Corynebacterium sp.]